MDNTTYAAVIVQWFGVVMILTFAWVLGKAQFSRDSDINLNTLIIDKGVVTLAKFGGLLALLTSTWLVVFLAVDKSLTEGIFIGYVVGWGGVKIAADFTGRPQPGTEVTTETASKTTEKGAPVESAPVNPLKKGRK